MYVIPEEEKNPHWAVFLICLSDDEGEPEDDDEDEDEDEDEELDEEEIEEEEEEEEEEEASSIKVRETCDDDVASKWSLITCVYMDWVKFLFNTHKVWCFSCN